MIHVEPWSTGTSGPYLVIENGLDVGDCSVVEDGGDLRPHPGDVSASGRLAFVDGVRRADARLYQQIDGRTVHGVAGVHGHGAVLCEPDQRPVFGRCEISRLVVWGAGEEAALPEQRGGWSWQTRSVTDEHPDAPLRAIQRMMREAEGRLAERLIGDGWVTVVDGPLNFVRNREVAVVGYIKTHHQALLPPEQHARVPRLDAGQRTSVFAKRDDIYSCYLRLTSPPPYAGPWAGIARLEIPASVGLDAAIEAADRATGLLPRYAGVPHKDPRAPQNLQPVASLESHLHRLLGDRNMAIRAIRTAAMTTTTDQGGVTA